MTSDHRDWSHRSMGFHRRSGGLLVDVGERVSASVGVRHFACHALLHGVGMSLRMVTW
jgi:hypothetical protein